MSDTPRTDAYVADYVALIPAGIQMCHTTFMRQLECELAYATESIDDLQAMRALFIDRDRQRLERITTLERELRHKQQVIDARDVHITTLESELAAAREKKQRQRTELRRLNKCWTRMLLAITLKSAVDALHIMRKGKE